MTVQEAGVDGGPGAPEGAQALLRCDTNFVIREESVLARFILGAAEASLVGRSLLTLLAPESHAAMLQLVGTSQGSREITFERLDGGRTWGRLSVWFDNNEWVVGVYDNATLPSLAEPAPDADITALKLAERSIRVLTQRLELALSTSGLGIWEVNLEDLTFSYDEALARMYDFPPNEKLSLESFVKQLHPDDTTNTMKRVKHAVAEGSRLENDFRIYRSDGELRHITTLGVVHQGVDGRPRLLGVDRDVTDIVEREARLKDQNRLFESALENMEHGLTMFDAEGRLIVANRQYADIFELPPELIVPGTRAKPIREHVIASGILSREMVEGSLDDILSTPGKVEETVWELGSGRVVAFTVTPLAEGGWISVHRDITEQHKAEKELAASEERFRDFTTTASDWCWETDAENRVTFVTASFESHTGVPADVVFGKVLFEIPFSDHDEATLRSLFAPPEDGVRKPFRDVLLSLLQPGRTVHMRVSGTPRHDSDDRFIGYRGTGTDVTLDEFTRVKLARTEAQLSTRTAQLVEAQKIGRIGDWSYMLGDTHVWWAPHTYELLATSPEEFDTTHEAVMARYLDDGPARVLRSQAEAARTGETRSVDVKVLKVDRSTSDFVINSKPVLDGNGKLAGFRGTIQDISARKEAEEQLEKLAYFDPLTSLANRALFQRELDRVIRHARKNGVDAALLLLDLDRFKEINDAWGHEAGDELLRKVAQKLSVSLPQSSFLARLGGDEFAIIATKVGGRTELEELGNQVALALREPMSLQRGEVRVGTSIGIALIPEDGSTSIELMRNADMALYKAKEAGRGCYRFFEPMMSELARSKLSLSRDLWEAIGNDKDLSVHYQPQINMETGQVNGFEALMRWNHPVHGMIPPSRFIPIAESSRLICDLGLWILDKAARKALAWHEKGHDWSVSVNVSAAQLWHTDLASDVAKVLEKTGVPPRLICLELTESLFADHTEEQLKRALNKLSDLGVRLSLDDFGTGYSSLGYLRHLPFAELKIDRLFVNGAAGSPRSRNVLEGIIALAHGLNMRAVAEGVEEPEEIDILREMGCDVLQGYVFSRPVPAEEAYAYALERTRLLEAESA